jgi:hypothetical protein
MLDRALPDGGSSVIVKTRRVEGEGHGGPAHLRREYAGLCLGASANVAPRVLGFDDAAGVIAVADLGRSPTVEAVLLGDDERAASRAMAELGRAVSFPRIAKNERSSTRSGAGVLRSLLRERCGIEAGLRFIGVLRPCAPGRGSDLDLLSRHDEGSLATRRATPARRPRRS